MAAVILIVFLAIVAILGGWWLRRERVNQKKELHDRGKIAAGRFDEVVLPGKKPKRRRKKGKYVNQGGAFVYVAREIPSGAALDGWLAKVEAVVNELMPCVIKYREGKALDGPAQQALELAGSKLITCYPSDALTDVEAQEWFSALEGRLRAYYDAKDFAEASSSQLRKLLSPARDRAFELGRLVNQAEDWELYKAPEPFHEKLEIVTLLFKHLKYELELDLDSQQPGFSPDKSSRRTDAFDEGFNRQNAPRHRRKSWDTWDFAENEPEPVQDADVAGRCRQTLVDALPSIAALAAAVDAACASQKQYGEAAKHIPLTRPVKPNAGEVDALLATAQAWAKMYQSTKVQAHNDGAKVLRCVENATVHLAQVENSIFDDAIRLGNDSVLECRHYLLRAYDQLVAYVKSAPGRVEAVTRMAVPYSLDEESQTDKDAAVNLRNLMRKAAFALAQSEAAKANYEAAKGEHVWLAETVPPVLTQSSASAYVNAYSRMIEINSGNTLKIEAHNARVKLLSGQYSEREQQAREAVHAVRRAVDGLGGKAQEWSAALHLMHSTATLFSSAFNE